MPLKAESSESPRSCERERWETEKEEGGIWSMKGPQLTTADFEDRKGATSQRMWWSPETGNDRKQILPWSRQKHRPWISAQWGSSWTSDLQSRKIKCLCYSEPLLCGTLFWLQQKVNAVIKGQWVHTQIGVLESPGNGVGFRTRGSSSACQENAGCLQSSSTNHTWLLSDLRAQFANSMTKVCTERNTVRSSQTRMVCEDRLRGLVLGEAERSKGEHVDLAEHGMFDIQVGTQHHVQRNHTE